MYQKFTKNLLTVAMLLVFCAFTNNTNAQTSWNISDNSSSGNNVTATLTLADSVLTISGTGNMADFLYSSTGIPWNSYLTRIKTVVINSGVTNIGDIAFQGCINLQWITIPEGVTIIGTQAFENCTSLLAIAIPASVITIEDRAFRNCNALKAIYNMATTPQNISNRNIFDGVTSFSGKYLAVPAQSVTNYQSASIWGNFTVTEPYFLIEENLSNDIDVAIIGVDGSAHYFKYRNNNPNLSQEYVIYDGTGTIPAMAISFNQDGLPERYVSSDGTTFFVDGYNGNYCNGLLQTSDGNIYAIDNILIDGLLQDIYNFPYDLAKGTAKKVIAKAIEKALSGQLPTLDATIILEALQGTFESKVKGMVVNYVMPNEIKYLYSCLSFATTNASMIKSCVFAGQVSPYAFAGGPVGWVVGGVLWANCLYNVHNTWVAATKMTKNLADMFAGWTSNNNSCSVTAKLNGGTLVIAGDGALCSDLLNEYTDRKSEITTLIIRGGVTSIPSWAFENCISLTDVEFSNGNGILTLGYSMFSGSNSIETVHYGRNLSGWDAPFQSKTTLKKVTFNNNITSIPAGSFSGCSDLTTSITLPNSVTEIGSSAFSGCSSLKTITVSSNVTEIGNSAFSNCGLTSIIIPESVTSIGSWAFENCTSLTDVEFSNGNGILTLGYSMFSGSNSIETVHYGRNLSGWDAPFQSKTTLKKVTFNNNIGSIPASSFSDCTGLNQITCNATTPPTLGSYAFYNVSKSIPVYINCNYLSTYQSAPYWNEFTNYQCAVQIVPASNSAVVTFPEIDNAITYTLSIYSDENYTNSLVELHLDAYGNLKSAPAQNALKAATTLSYTVSGLSANTRYYYSLTPYDAGGYMLTVFTGDFTTTAGSGIESIAASQMSIYPNPAKDEIFIQSELPIEKVEIYSLTGTLLILENNFTEKISVSVLPKGIYLLKVYTDKGLAISKMVKE